MKAYDLPMQVTDAMVEAAIQAYRALPVAPETLQMDGILMRDAIQAALEAAPERDDVEPPPFVVALSEEKLRLWDAGAADAVRKLLASRTVWRNLAKRQGAELEQLRAEDDARAPLWLVELSPEGIPLPNGGVIRMATPEEHAARMDQFRREIDEVIAHRPRCRCAVEPVTAAPGDATAHGQFHNEGGDFLPGPKRYRTGAPVDDAPGIATDAPEALGSFTAPLDGSDGRFLLVNAREIAEHLDVDLDAVHDWIEHAVENRFPEPYKNGHRWQLGAVEQWYARWKGPNGG